MFVWLRGLLLLVMVVAVSLPPRLHAMTQSAHPQSHSQAIAHAGHHAGDDHGGGSGQRHNSDSYTLCMTACASLPAMPLSTPAGVPTGAGKRLSSLIAPSRLFDGPEPPAPPPRSFS